MTEHQSKIQQRLRPLVLDTIDRVGSYESAKGWLRYEKMRKLNMPELIELRARNMDGEMWDDMIDELIADEIRDGKIDC